MVYVIYSQVSIAGDSYEKLVFSSDRLKFNSFFRNFKQDIAPLVALLKQIPSSDRSYDQKTKIWIVKSSKFSAFSALACHMFPNTLIFCPLPFWQSVEDFINIKQTTDQKVFNAEEFFYNTSQPTTQKETPESLANKLEDMLKLIEPEFKIANASNIDLKKLYRRAAMEFHPDRNAGDASRMTELNYLYQQYTK